MVYHPQICPVCNQDAGVILSTDQASVYLDGKLHHAGCLTPVGPVTESLCERHGPYSGLRCQACYGEPIHLTGEYADRMSPEERETLREKIRQDRKQSQDSHGEVESSSTTCPQGNSSDAGAEQQSSLPVCPHCSAGHRQRSMPPLAGDQFQCGTIVYESGREHRGSKCKKQLPECSACDGTAYEQPFGPNSAQCGVCEGTGSERPATMGHNNSRCAAGDVCQNGGVINRMTPRPVEVHRRMYCSTWCSNQGRAMKGSATMSAETNLENKITALEEQNERLRNAMHDAADEIHADDPGVAAQLRKAADEW